MHAGGIGRINKDGVDYYHRLIDYMIGNRKHNDLGLPLCSCHGDITFLRMQIWRHVKTRHVFFFAPDITPYVVLYHYDLPQVLQDQYNGWLSPRVVLVFTINTTISFLHQIYKNIIPFCFRKVATQYNLVCDHACGACHFAGKISPSSRIFASRRTVTV
jgi:beta-glucosidase